MHDGHIGNSWVSVMMKAREPKLLRDWHVEHCLFGLHLITPHLLYSFSHTPLYPTIALVEKEIEFPKDAERDIWKMFKKILVGAIIVYLIAALLCLIVLIVPKSSSRHNIDDINSRKEDIIRGE